VNSVKYMRDFEENILVYYVCETAEYNVTLPSLTPAFFADAL